MAVLFKAIMGEIAFLVDKYTKLTTPTMEDECLHNLERLLLRVRVIVDEAEGRHITNQAMVCQLNLLRKEMYRGYFTMDNLRSKGIEAKVHGVSPSFVLSKFNTAKHIFFSTIDTYRGIYLQQVLLNLNNVIEDSSGLVMFLKNYPPLYRQPYSMHLYVGKCMFGRQMEMERIMDFLMQKENPGTKGVGVLPVVGIRYVGKSTLVAHVCNDTRVRNYFSRIVVINGDDIDKENLSTIKDGDAIMHKMGALGKNEILLAIIKFSMVDVDEAVWNSFYSSFGGCLGRGSKIIITSRSNKTRRFGTTPALILNFLPQEAFWYFYKVLTFGSADPTDHPELESIAMEIAMELNGSFIGANVTSGFLRRNIVSQNWLMFRAHCRASIQRNLSLFGEKTYDRIYKSKPTLCQTNHGEFVISEKHRACVAGDNVPMITMEDVVSGSVKCEGEFDVLAWKSHILPYKSYIVSCMIEKSV